MLNRRIFLGAGAGVAAAGLLPAWARAQSPGLGAPASEFDLRIAQTEFSVGGRTGVATSINGGVPGPLLRWREGDQVTLRVTNALEEDASIHWHGILLPNGMDGVPGVTFDGIAPGETFTYRFPVRQSGTYWYHSHSRFQEQTGVYGPIVIDPAGGERVGADRDYVVVLSDWSFDDPERIFANLKRQSDYYNYQKRTVGDFLRDVREDGWDATVAERRMWAAMRMNPTDLADVSAPTYSYLMNGQGPDANWTALFAPGERVRLRVINASAMTLFDVRIPGLPMTVVAADGVDVEPVETDELRIAVAETYDVIVSPTDDRAFTLFAESMDRSGYARGTLATQAGAAAEVPALRQRPVRSMADMGHDMGSMGGHEGHDMSSMPAADAGAELAGHDMSAMAASGAATSPAGHDMSAMPAEGAGEHAGHDMTAMASGAAAMDQSAAPAVQTGAEHAGHDMSAAPAGDAMDQSGHDRSSMTAPASEQAAPAAPAAASGDPVREGPGVDMRMTSATERLDDPGVGLGEDGWRVLSYAQLKGAADLKDAREPGRDLELHLTSNMERYMWSFDGVRFSEVDGPIELTYGERLRLVLVNETMMEHPVHLHGMFVELDNGAGARP